MQDLDRTNKLARSQQPVNFPEIPDYAIAALTTEWDTQTGHTAMPDSVITCTLAAYQGACKAWGIEKLPHVLIYREQLFLKAEYGFSMPRRMRDRDFARKEFKKALAQWNESDKETYVAFEVPSFVLAAAKAQLPEEI